MITTNKLTIGNNLEVMKSMKSESIDLCGTDPPFNNGRPASTNSEI